MANDDDIPNANANNQEKETSKEGADESEFIKLKVVSQDANEIHFRVKTTTKMGKLKKSFADRVGRDLGTLRFLFDGRRVNDNDTPKQLEMEDDDVIEVFAEQKGGSQDLLKISN